MTACQTEIFKPNILEWVALTKIFLCYPIAGSDHAAQCHIKIHLNLLVSICILPQSNCSVVKIVESC